ncbi:hypothetical protein GDO81_014771 [Engystomops pustulosus]|uniref:Uncharacterized protein n=1 Tax=Engystomops pustulosus TaxID=76066 RepID=A0AAV7AJA5_ENGPU|nr:hypothetical protein GDO81_014771 [Engystomops pustulosus]
MQILLLDSLNVFSRPKSLLMMSCFIKGLGTTYDVILDKAERCGMMSSRRQPFCDIILDQEAGEIHSVMSSWKKGVETFYDVILDQEGG